MTWRHRHTLVVLALPVMFFALFARLVFSPVVPEIIEAFGSSKAAIGLALSGMWAAYAIVQYPGGVLADRFGEKRIVLLSLGLTGVSSLLVALSVSYATFVVAVVLIGASAGLYPPAATSLLSKRFSNTGRVLGFHVAGGNAAGLIGPIVAAYVAVRFGWRSAPLLTVALAVPLFAAFALFIRPTAASRPEVPMRTRFTPRALIDIMARPGILYTSAIGVVGIFVFQAVASFLPTFLIEFWSLDIQYAGALFGVVYLFSALFMPVLGSASDYVGRDYAMAASFLVAAVALGLLLAGRGIVPPLAAVVLLGTGITWGGTIQSRFMDLLSEAERGTGFGLVRTATGLLGATGSVVTGTLADTAGWAAAYGLVIGLLVLAVAAVVLNRALDLGL